MDGRRVEYVQGISGGGRRVGKGIADRYWDLILRC